MHIVGGGIPPSPPRIFNGGGDAHRVKGDAHPPLPYVHPPLPYVPVTPYVQLKFPRVINPDSPLNDSRQLDWWWWVPAWNFQEPLILADVICEQPLSNGLTYIYLYPLDLYVKPALSASQSL